MRALFGVVAALTAATLQTAVEAAEYPARPIRMIVPYAPGGASDFFARVLAERFTAAWGQQVVVDNRAGAGGNIGSDIVAKANPDGYTMLLGTSGSNAVNPSLYTKMPYDAKRDLALIAMVASTSNILVVRTAHPAKSVQDIIRMAKANPGKVTYGSSGVGSVLHLSGELLKTVVGINIVHVPYKGTGPAVVDLMAGHVQLQFASMPAAINFVRAGKLRMIAQAGAKRSPAAPDVPTMVESGLPGYIISSGFSVFGPANLPRPIVDRVHGAIKSSLANAEVRKSLSDQGADPVGSTPEEHDKFNRAEIEKWIKVARGAGIEPQ